MTTVTDALENRKMPQTGLLRRLSYCLAAFLVVFLVCFYFAGQIFQFLSQPVADAMIANNIVEQDQRMVFTALSEVFFTYVKVAFFAAVFFCLSFFLAQFLLFWRQRRGGQESLGAVGSLAILALPLFLGGALAYYVVYPPVLEFFFTLNVPASDSFLPMLLEAATNEYLSVLMKMIFAFGLVFQLPVGLFLFFRAGKAATSSDRFA